MIVFKTVKIQNFLSYGNDEAEVVLSRENPTLISGINYDASTNGEFDSNGSGKSTILEAVAVALYDKPIGMDNPKKNALINNINNKDMLLTLELSTKKKNYTIYRFRKNKAMGGDGVLIEENGKDITPDSTANANKFIADHIMEIPYEIFGKIVAYAAGADSFLKMDLSTQRGIIEELFSYTELSEKANILKEKIKNNKKDLEYAKETNEDIKDEYRRHKEQLEEAEQDHVQWKKDHKDQISKCENQISKLSEIDFEKELSNLKSLESIKEEIRDVELNIRDKRKEISNLESITDKFNKAEEERAVHLESTQEQLSKMTISEEDIDSEHEIFSKIEEAEKDVEAIQQKKENQERELRKLNKNKDKLEAEKDELEDSKCPYCSQQYSEAKEKLKEVEKEIEQHSKEIKEIKKEIDGFEKEQKKLAKFITDSEKELNFDSIKDLENYVSEKKEVEKNLEYYENYKNPYENKTDETKTLYEEISKLEKKLSSKKTKLEKVSKECSFDSMDEYYSSKNKVDSLEETLKYLNEQTNPYDKILKSLKEYEPKPDKDEEIDQLIDEIKHQEFLLKLLTKKDSFIRKALMDKYLPFLNERLKNYLSMMGLPHKVRFTSDLSTEISQFGKEISYSILSSGQRARIDIALSLAFRDVLQSKHNFINLFILDECLDVGLSNVGVKKTLKVIKDVAKNNKLSMFIISHRDEIRDAFKDRIDIELRNGFSSVV